MPSPTPNNNTTQQCREHLLLAQAERQRARELEIAKQETKFAAEMERLEEEAAQEAEEIRLAEERKLRKLEEEKRVAEEQKKKQEKLAEAKKIEDEWIAWITREANKAKLKAWEDRKLADTAEDAEEEQAWTTAFAKLVEENKKEQEKAAKELEKQQRHIPAIKLHQVDVVILSRPLGSKKKSFKSGSIVSDDSDEEDGEYDPDLKHDNEQPLIDCLPSRPACSQHVQFVTSNGNNVAGPGIMPPIDREGNGLNWMMRCMRGPLRKLGREGSKNQASQSNWLQLVIKTRT
ncbi:hypothetical protein GGU11DRAFT_858083 [Lentinula aff. detonsa]|nr:hypothetical protein GGU11DRAFT_858083 [Lentinula aff. detonsa]